LCSHLDGEPAAFHGSEILIEEHPFVRKVGIRGRAHDAGFKRRFAEILGVAPTAPGRSTETVQATILSVGPSEWLTVDRLLGSATPRPAANDLRARLAAAGIVVVDLSSATTILRISGPGCSSTLRGLCALQLDQLPSGSVARTRIGRLAILVHVLGSARFDLFVPRSYAKSFCDQLRDAAELRT
jgi:heterotetrameric sarcosine oxidase gamma subunit